MKILLVILIEIFIVALFLYSKLLQYKDKLNDKNLKIFNFFNSIFEPILKFLKKIFKPFEVGQGLSIDLSSIVLLIVMLIMLIILTLVF